MKGSSYLAGLSMLGLLAATAPAHAQQATGEISGRVADTSGAVLPGVEVTLTGPVLLQPLTTITSESGTYRFSELTVGQYDVRFDLEGFKSVVNRGARVTLGTTTAINVELDVSTVEETITVSAEAPIIDTSRVGTRSSFTQEQLQDIPSQRDPWGMLSRAPGVAMDRVNVGGSQSGQQAGHISRGGNTANNKWLVDGVDITDQAATGASPVYFDFDAFEEMQFSTGGNDVTQQTGGVGINLVTKSGTDQFRGQGRLYVTDERFGSNNLTDDLRTEGAKSGAPIQNIQDYGVEAGGPIYPGRAWFWGAYGKQDIKIGVVNFFKRTEGCPIDADDPLASTLPIKDINNCLEADLTTLNNYNMKGTGRLFEGNTVSWHSFFADKVRSARDASDTRPIETTYRQEGPVWTHKFSDRHVFNDRWLAEVQVAHVGGGFSLLLQDPSLESVQALEDIGTDRWARAYRQWSIFDRPATSVDATSNYFLPATLGGDHAFKLGFRWRDTPTTSQTLYSGSGAVAQIDDGVPARAQFYRNAISDAELTTWAFYAQDSFTRKRWTLTAGLRVDRQEDGLKPSTIDANPIIPDWLPAVSFAGAKSGVAFTDVSPRLGVNYDVSGTGRTVLRSSFSVYYGQLAPTGSARSNSGLLNTVSSTNVIFPWDDLNGDLQVQRNEIDEGTVIDFGGGGGWDPDDPTAEVTSPNSVDPDLRNDRTRELIAGIDHQIGNSMSVSFSYIYRNYDNFAFSKVVGISSDDWVPVDFTPSDCIAGARCPTLTYYEPMINIPNVQRRQNQNGYSRAYNGFELAFSKRMSDRWMADVSYAYNDAVERFDSPDDRVTVSSDTLGTGDPTNFDIFNNAQYAPEAGGSGIDNVFQNTKHLLKASGQYRLPLDISVGAVFNSFQGYIFPQRVQSPDRANRAGRAWLYLDPYGESRYGAFSMLDIRVAKRFNFGGRMIEGSMDVFNVGNVNTVLTRNLNQAASTANQVTGIVAPRVIRFGLRLTF